MKFQFPEIKTTRDLNQRIDKVKDELKEFEEAKTQEEKDEEIVDVIHSLETLLRKQFEGRENILDSIISKVIEKNTKRNYYSKECF